MKSIAVVAILVVSAIAAPAGQQPSPRQEPIAASSPLYGQLLPLFRAFHPGLTDLTILDRRIISRAYTLLLVHATVPSPGQFVPRDLQDFRGESFGLFVIDASSGSLYMQVDLFGTGRWLDWQVTIEGVNPHRVDIRREGATYGDGLERVRYFLDLPGRRVINAIRHLGVGVEAVAEFDGALYFVVGVGTEKSIVTKVTPATTGGPSVINFEAIDAIDGREIQRILVARAQQDRLVLQGETTQYVLTGNRWQTSPNPDADLFRIHSGSGATIGLPEMKFFDVLLYRVRERLVRAPTSQDPSRRLLVWHHPESMQSGIFVLSRTGRKFRAMPRATDHPDYSNSIGPSEFDGRLLWFGISFYSGEGSFGEGGVGTFDPATGKYRIKRPAAIVGWSVSALRLDGKYIWLGLARYREGPLLPGGLVRYEPATGAIRQYAIPHEITAIRRLGASLFVGTSDGIFILTRGNLRRVVFDIDVTGKYQPRLSPP